MRQPSSSLATSRRGGGEGGSTATTTSKVGLKRGPWTPEEDELLANYIKKEGEGRWRMLPKRAGLHRCGKSCRLRWMNYLRPSVKRGQIAPDEEDLILRLHRLLGNRWSLIAGRIPGRTDNEIKNYWNTHLSKKLISQGIDPRTHKPLNPNITSNISLPDDKPSSSKLANNIPNPNPNPGSSSLERSLSNGRAFVNKGSINYHGGAGVNSSVSGMGLRSDHNGLDNEDGTDDINYCTDDELSWLLNSLINNEDTLNSSTHQVQQHQTKMIIPPQTIAPTAGSDALIFPPQAFGFAAGWDAPIMSRKVVLCLFKNPVNDCLSLITNCIFDA